MSTPYTEFKYLYPPRTEMKIPNDSAVRKVWANFEDSIGQFKLNGSRNLFVVFPNGSIECWNRHGEKQKQYLLTPSTAASIRSLNLPEGKFHIIDGELLHAKTKIIKDVHYVWDMLVYNGEYLLGETYRNRYSLLHEILNKAKISYFPLDFKPKEGNIYLAENFAPDKWDWMWKQAQLHDVCEGMVLKRTGAISALNTGYREINNDGFMMRVRKPNKNYRN